MKHINDWTLDDIKAGLSEAARRYERANTAQRALINDELQILLKEANIEKRKKSHLPPGPFVQERDASIEKMLKFYGQGI